MSDPTQATPAPAAPIAPAPAAPAAAPVAPVLPAPPAPPTPAPQPAPAPPVGPASVKFDPTGDPLLDTALDYVGSLGIEPSDPAIEAAREGDFSLLEAKLAALGDKAKDKDRYIAMAKRAYEAEVAKTDAKNAAVEKTVFEVVGGKDNWAAIQTWAAAQATEDEKEQINAAFAAGGLQAKAAAQYLHEAFRRAGRPGVTKAAATSPAAGAAPTGVEPLTARDYARAVDELSRANKGRNVNHLPEYQTLRARRQAGRAAGL